MRKIIIREWPPPPEKKIKRPPRWRTFWMPVGTIVEYRGYVFQKDMVGAADTWTTQWLSMGKAS